MSKLFDGFVIFVVGCILIWGICLFHRFGCWIAARRLTKKYISRGETIEWETVLRNANRGMVVIVRRDPEFDESSIWWFPMDAILCDDGKPIDADLILSSSKKRLVLNRPRLKVAMRSILGVYDKTRVFKDAEREIVGHPFSPFYPVS